jgi:hypothetical protein
MVESLERHTSGWMEAFHCEVGRQPESEGMGRLAGSLTG